ncbi:hypothetical protein V6O07_18695, partial [Arthrospira platensis SPKY2]
MDARFTSGPFSNNRVPLVPAVHGTTTLSWRPIATLQGSLHHHWFSARYQGNDFDNSLRKIGAFHRLDVRLAADYHALTLFLRINNILNDNHAPVA